MAFPASAILEQEKHINDNRQPYIIAVSAICLPAAYVAVALRFVARRLARTSLEADDYSVLLALFFTTIFVTTVLIGVHYGEGRHWILVTNGTAYAKDTLAAAILYSPATATTKFSILLLYRRIFPIRRFVIVLWCVGAFVAAYSITAAMVNLLQCLPIRADWGPSPQPRCINVKVELIVLSTINAVTDVIILALPMPLVWRLHMSKSRKLQISCTFFLGGLVCVASILRAIYVSQVSSIDESWDISNGAIWSVVETCVAVVSACLPLLRSLKRWSENKASAREKYEASYTPKDANNSDNIKMLTRESSGSQNVSLRGQEAAEEPTFNHLDNGF